MSRHGYVDFDGEDVLAEGRWRGAMLSAIRGKRGQAFLRELIEALDALPAKELAAHSFTRGGEVCALGSVALKRGLDVSEFEPGEGEDSWDDEIDHDVLAATNSVSPLAWPERSCTKMMMGPGMRRPRSDGSASAIGRSATSAPRLAARDQKTGRGIAAYPRSRALRMVRRSRQGRRCYLSNVRSLGRHGILHASAAQHYRSRPSDADRVRLPI